MGARATLVLMLVVMLAGCAKDSEPGPSAPTATPPVPGPLRVEQRAAGLDEPLWAILLPGTQDLLVVERAGTILRLDQHGRTQAWGNLTDRVGSASTEQGLLGLALHPTFAAGGAVIVSYTDRAGDTVVSRFMATAAGIDALSEEVLLSVDQPFANHNGGHILYGPDGMLYFGLGDGGAANDPLLNGQNRNTLLGSLLRLDVGTEGPYRIPADNPFAGDATGADEVWSYGLRNPWRFAFDEATGDLWIADVGQNNWEEVNHLPAASGYGRGANLGWNVFEGNHPTGTTAEVKPSGFTFPLAEYTHAEGCSITGGHVYHGSALPALAGAYVYGDFCTGTIWAVWPDGTVQELLGTDARISSFAVDADGEVLVLDLVGGRILRLVGAMG